MSTITYESNVPLWTEKQALAWKETWDGKRESIPDEMWKYCFEVFVPQLDESISRMTEELELNGIEYAPD